MIAHDIRAKLLKARLATKNTMSVRQRLARLELNISHLLARSVPRREFSEPADMEELRESLRATQVRMFELEEKLDDQASEIAELRHLVDFMRAH